MTITKFIAAGNTYTFPTSPGDQSYDSNFGDSSPRIVRLYGTDGGFDENGMGRAASDPGTVTFDIVLVSATRAGMQPLRDALKTMVSWGKGRLIDTINGVDRWCWARISSADIKELRHQNTDLFQPVRLTFSVSDPYWYAAGTLSKLWGGGLTWGGGTTWGGAGTFVTSTSITVNGSAPTLMKVTIKNASGSDAYDPILRRYVNGAIVDQIKYTGLLANGKQLNINPYNHTATIDGVSVIGNLTALHPQWMRLMPGANSVDIQPSGSFSFQSQFYDRYF